MVLLVGRRHPLLTLFTSFVFVLGVVRSLFPHKLQRLLGSCGHTGPLKICAPGSVQMIDLTQVTFSSYQHLLTGTLCLYCYYHFQKAVRTDYRYGLLFTLVLLHVSFLQVAFGPVAGDPCSLTLCGICRVGGREGRLLRTTGVIFFNVSLICTIVLLFLYGMVCCSLIY